MPIYEYQCPQCHTVFEEWLSVSEASETAPCPHCATIAIHIISNTAFVLKGGGWYVTDYGNRKSTTDAPQADKGQTVAENSAKPETAANAKEKSASAPSSVTPSAASSAPPSASPSNVKHSSVASA